MSSCRATNAKPLDPANLTPAMLMADGCPCNSPRGINHGLVERRICTCDKCDPERTGAARAPRDPSASGEPTNDKETP